MIQPILDETLNSFAKMRGEWMVSSFRPMLARVEEVDEGGIWEGGRGKEKVAALIDLWDAMPIMAEVKSSRHSKGAELTHETGRDITCHLSLPKPSTPESPSRYPWAPHLCHHIRHPAYHIDYQTVFVKSHIPSPRALHCPHLRSIHI
jgi:hypothetical protein